MRTLPRPFLRDRGIRRIIGALAVAGMLALLAPAAPAAAPHVATEPQVKVLFVLNFMKFVEWPASAFSDPTAPIVVGVAGTSTFSTLLGDLRHERVRGRPLIVKELAAGEDPSACHVLVIGRVDRNRMGELLWATKSTPTLTISEVEQFCEQGGIIRLLTENGSVRFEVNPASASAARLTISAKLLQLARTVVPRSPAAPAP